MENKVEIVTKYNKRGVITAISANGIPMVIPDDLPPSVQILRPDVDWVIEKVYMTPEEVKAIYGDVK